MKIQQIYIPYKYRGKLCNNKPLVFCLQRNLQFSCLLFKSVCQCSHTADQWNTTWNTLASLLMKNSFEICRKGDFMKRKHEWTIVQNSSSKASIFSAIWWRLLFKMQHFAKCARESQWMCSTRCDVNNICKLRYWTKAYRKCQHSAGGLSDYDAFSSSVQVSWNISSALSRLLFKIFSANETFAWLKLVSLT